RERRMTPHPTAQADQFHAAAEDARRRLTVIAAAGGAGVSRATDPTGWLTRQARGFVDALTSTQGRFCWHIGSSPHVVHAAVWAPGVVVCSACVHLLRPTSGEDATCDRCRRTVDPLHPGIAAFGPVLIMFGLCDQCQAATGLPVGVRP
ncbi:hypothetical protein AB1484_37415, partial [Parafrankia sp. FMc6]|uniref:hypothetical protein n=1 Tax=Parafrankia soli TaxID=2599596 RepID=UPI0034D611B0